MSVVRDQTHGGNFKLMGHVTSSIPCKDSIYAGENPNVYKSFGQKTRQNAAAPVFSDALAFDPVTIDDLNHLEHFIFGTIHLLRKHTFRLFEPHPSLSMVFCFQNRSDLL